MVKQKPTLNQTDITLLQKTFATKRDLQTFAKKKDLQQFATKQDLKRFATKQDLRGFATKKDLVSLRKEIINAITDYLAKNYVTKTEFGELKEQILRLPTKDEFLEKMDEITGDYQKFLQERDAIQHQLEQLKSQMNIT
jgi:hypothetical protein